MATSPWDPVKYDEAWAQMAAAGKDPHGEVAFMQRLLLRFSMVERADQLTFLDAGCGTGRVAVELDKRGYRVVGTDIDSVMLSEAMGKAPHLNWVQADLTKLELGETFDFIIMAGNVILFVDDADRPRVAPALRAHSKPGTLVIAGLQLAREDGRRVPLVQYDEWMSGAQFELVERFGTWDEDPWSPESDYAVSVHRAVT